MKSHSYNFRLGDLARLLGWPLTPMVIAAALLRLWAMCHLLPAPWPALDVDRTILTHQANASRQTNSADILLIGDSSCLMDVSASRLNEILEGHHQALNLGTFMYVGFDGYGAMLARYASVNMGRLRS